MKKTLPLLLLIAFLGVLVYANSRMQQNSAAGAKFLITLDKLDITAATVTNLPLFAAALKKAEDRRDYTPLQPARLLAAMTVEPKKITQYPELAALLDTCDPGDKTNFTAPSALILTCRNQYLASNDVQTADLGRQLQTAAREWLFLKNNGSDMHARKKNHLCELMRPYIHDNLKEKDFAAALPAFYFSECSQQADTPLFSKIVDQAFRGCMANTEGRKDFALEKNPCIERVIGDTDPALIPQALTPR